MLFAGQNPIYPQIVRYNPTASFIVASPDLALRILRFFGQRVAAWRDFGEPEFFHRRISAVQMQVKGRAVMGKPIMNRRKFFFFDFPRVSPGDQPLTIEPEDSGYEIVLLLYLSSAIKFFLIGNKNMH